MPVPCRPSAHIRRRRPLAPGRGVPLARPSPHTVYKRSQSTGFALTPTQNATPTATAQPYQPRSTRPCHRTPCTLLCSTRAYTHKGTANAQAHARTRRRTPPRKGMHMRAPLWTHARTHACGAMKTAAERAHSKTATVSASAHGNACANTLWDADCTREGPQSDPRVTIGAVPCPPEVSVCPPPPPAPCAAGSPACPGYEGHAQGNGRGYPQKEGRGIVSGASGQR